MTTHSTPPWREGGTETFHGASGDAGDRAQEGVEGSTVFERGAFLGRYLVLDLLGRGGMGEVYVRLRSRARPQGGLEDAARRARRPGRPGPPGPWRGRCSTRAGRPSASSYVDGELAQIRSRLTGGQSVGVVIESFGAGAVGISGESLALLARRWCELAQRQPEVEHVVGFHWNGSGGGTHDIIHLQPPADAANYNLSVESAHRAVARAALDQGSGSCRAPE